MGTLAEVLPEIDAPETKVCTPARQTSAPEIFRRYLLTAVWFGLFAGLLDGAELLLFQRVNWEQWGRIVHVSKPILWMAPLVNVIVFVMVAVLIATTEWVIRVKALQLLTWITTFATVFDVLSATGRVGVIAMLLAATGVAVFFDRWFRLHQLEALRFWRKTCPWLLALALLAFAAVQGGTWLWERHETASLPKPIAGTPNVVLIVIDTLRADHLSSYGYSRTTTPNLDRIGKQGVLFENAISASSWTFPSHASILTGVYPSQHGMQDLSSMRLGSAGLSGYTTLSEALEARGYRTAAFSANHYFFTSSVGLSKGFIHFEDYYQSPGDIFRRTSLGCAGQMYLAGCGTFFKRAPEVSQDALTWIGKGTSPFFVFLNYFGLHEADRRLWKRTRPVWGSDNEVDRYDSALTYADAEIGRLFQELQKRGLTDNTLFLLTSDHGQSLGQHHLHSHASTLYLEQIHVPLIIWYPGHVPSGVRVATPVSTVSIAATIMSLIAGKAEPFTGPGLLPLWTKESGLLGPPSPMSELAKNDVMDNRDKLARTAIPTALDGNMKSIITPQWHLIEHQTLGKQLYDWVNDPGELENLADNPQGAIVARDLEMQIQGGKSLSVRSRGLPFWPE